MKFHRNHGSHQKIVILCPNGIKLTFWRRKDDLYYMRAYQDKTGNVDAAGVNALVENHQEEEKDKVDKTTKMDISIAYFFV